MERMVMKMKKVMKALSLLVAGVLVLACFAGCAGQSGLAQIKEKGELVMLTNAAISQDKNRFLIGKRVKMSQIFLQRL